MLDGSVCKFPDIAVEMGFVLTPTYKNLKPRSGTDPVLHAPRGAVTRKADQVDVGRHPSEANSSEHV